jgi:predicted transcriptional regulator
MYADKQLSSGETAHAFIQFDNNDEWNAQHEASTSEEINTLQQLTKSSTVSEFMNIWEPYIQKIQQKQVSY